LGETQRLTPPPRGSQAAHTQTRHTHTCSPWPASHPRSARDRQAGRRRRASRQTVGPRRRRSGRSTARRLAGPCSRPLSRAARCQHCRLAWR
jgi:hypothetical protein